MTTDKIERFPKPFAFFRITLCFIAILCNTANADENDYSSMENNCLADAQGMPCYDVNDCTDTYGAEHAVLCVDGTCQIPCEDDLLHPVHGSCSLGETCTEGRDIFSDTRFYCKPSSFVMDINLLDTCLYYFIQDIDLTIISDEAHERSCVLKKNLEKLLDQDNNGIFNIFDVEKCIESFLDTKPCDTATKTCDNDKLYCDEDGDCGTGLHCDTALHRCQRECGKIVSRETDTTSGYGDNILERECAGWLETCDHDRGKCVAHPLKDQTCQVDPDCPNGAYCFLGECKKKCFRNIDCPSSDWMCSLNNTCMPRPLQGGMAAGYDPADFTVSFTVNTLSINRINDEYPIPVVFMNRETKKQEFDNPYLLMGYRLETKYGLKQSQICLGDPGKWDDATTKECKIESDRGEEFIILENPFGMLYATGNPTIDIRLNPIAAEKLSAGTYKARVNVFFNNGGSTGVDVIFQKRSPSGAYSGKMSVFLQGQEHHIGNSYLDAELFIDLDEKMITWQKLLEDNHLEVAEYFDDLTQGYPVHGYLDGQGSLVFNQPDASTTGANRIPVKGIYSPQYKQMRLVGVIDIPADFGFNSLGAPIATAPSEEMATENLFKRPIRRVFHFMGPFDDIQGLYSGIYREKILGLLPEDVVLEGGFRLKQTSGNEKRITMETALIPENSVVMFDNDAATAANDAAIDDPIKSYCDMTYGDFVDDEGYSYYMEDFSKQNRVLEDNLVNYGKLVDDALTLFSSPERDDSYLKIHDFMGDQIGLCSAERTEKCLDEKKLRCGLALYRRAILSGWVNLGDSGDQPDEPFDGQTEFDGGLEDEDSDSTPKPEVRQTLFCDDYSEDQDLCYETGSAAITTLQEHGRFYKALSSAISLEALKELSDAFYVMFLNGDTDEFNNDSIFDTKRRHLSNAIAKYEVLLEEIFSAPSTAVMYKWPMGEFKNRGLSWLTQIESVLESRMDAVESLIDIKRRKDMAIDGGDQIYLSHLLHMEFLHQAFLFGMGSKWQGDSFAFVGRGADRIERANLLLAKADNSRNPLGYLNNRVYFDENDMSLDNWEYYLNKAKSEVNELIGSDGNGGLVAIAKNAMKQSMANQAAFEEKALREIQYYEEQIESICGPDTPLPSLCTIGDEERKSAMSCQGEGCDFPYTCTDEDCKKVERVWQKGVGTAAEMACRLYEPKPGIAIFEDDTNNETGVGIEEGDTWRPCARGQVGELLQHRFLLEMERDNVYRRFGNLMRNIAETKEYLEEVKSDNENLVAELILLDNFLIIEEEIINAAQSEIQSAQAAVEAADCIIITGTANGDSCAAKGIATAALQSAMKSSQLAIKGAKINYAETLAKRNRMITESGLNETERRIAEQINQMLPEIDNLVSEYHLKTQQLTGLNLQITDKLTLAQHAAKRSRARVGQIIDHLTLFDSGDVTLRNNIIKTVDVRFTELLDSVYKTVQAFAHRYNLPSESKDWTTEVFQLMTPEDVKDFLDRLTDYERNICSASVTTDCHNAADTKTLFFSLQKRLFHHLTQKIDPNSGQVLSVGQQFHNLITSSAYVRKRFIGGKWTKQIEIPFSILPYDPGYGKNNTPLMHNECNQIISPNTGGTRTIAIAADGNGIGTGTGGPDNKPLQVQLYRGETDYIRSCVAYNEENTWPINKYTIGKSVENQFSLSSNMYYTITGNLNACKLMTNIETREECFHSFSVNRSVAAPDWMLIIPGIDDKEQNKWLLGYDPETDALKSREDRPVLGDLVLYIRYKSLPIRNN